MDQERSVNHIEFTIPGVPIAKKRPRFARRGKFVTTYSDQDTDEGKALWHIVQGIGWKDHQPITGPLEVHFIFTFPRPKSMTKKRAQDPRHDKKPDLDNLEKFYLDCMNGYVFKDDGQICEMRSKKKYGDVPSTNVWVQWE
jgi:Holliday junction resolvase RusA-like endonuclease